MSEPPMPEAPTPELQSTTDPLNRRRVAPLIALTVAAVLAGLFWVLAGSSAENDTAGLVGSHLLDEPAPAVRSRTLDDEVFDLARRKGSWVVVNFFNSTCVPCITEHPELVAFVEQQTTLGSDGAEFYTFLQFSDDVGNVRSFFEARGGDWPIIRDDDGGINVAFGVAQVPETFIIDPDGIVRVRWAGPIDAETLAQLVQQQRDGYALR